MVEYLYNEAIDMWTYDLCEVGAHPFVPDENRPHICGAFPLTEELLRQLVPEEGVAYTPFTPAIKDIVEWRHLNVDEKVRGPMAPKPQTLQDLLNAGRCCVDHAIKSSAGLYFLPRLAASLRDHGLDWRSADGHYWHAVTHRGAPELKLRQVYAQCICYRSSWQPCSRVLVTDADGRHVPFLSMFHGE